MQAITEVQRETIVLRTCDTVVVGGGFAGISAALASARNGSKTMLLEKEWLLGGLGTLGLVTLYLPLCDGEGHQVIAGIGEELLRLSLLHGAEEDHFSTPQAWLNHGTLEERKKERYCAQYSPEIFQLDAEKLLKENGVEIRYGTLVCGVQTKKNKITCVICEDKGGRFAIEAKSFIDCSGDADVCRLAGAPCDNFRQGNVMAAWHYTHSPEKRILRMIGCADVPDKYKSEKGKTSATRFTGLNGDDLNALVQLSHETILNRVIQEQTAGRPYPITSIATIPQIRMTRRLQGQYTLDDDEMFLHFDSSIGMTGDWRKCGPVYELPYEILCCHQVENLWAAGRCVSVTDAMWDITRVIPGCAVTGQAAGTAAALYAKKEKVEINALQQTLKAQEVLLHLQDAGFSS